MSNKNSEKYFQKVEENQLPLIKSVLEKRLPASCFMYNQLKTFSETTNEKVKADFTLYMYRIDVDSPKDDEQNFWILFRHMREDWNCCVYISPPTSSFQKTLPTSVAFALEHSDYIDWSKPFVFVCVDLHISEFLMKHNIYKLGNITKIYPCNIFYMSPEDALKLDTSAPSTKVTLAPLDKTTGVEFLHNQWSHSMPGTKQFIQKTVENHISGCVYLPCDPSEDSVSNPVSAGVVPASGLLSCLVTDPSHRRKGYASLVTKFIFKQMASQGYHPCLDADISNQAANKLYHSIPGSRNIAQVHFVCHKVL